MDKISELLSKLLDNSSLTILFIGVLLLIFSGAEKIPLGNTTLSISQPVKLILLGIGIVLVLISILSLKDQYSGQNLSRV